MKISDGLPVQDMVILIYNQCRGFILHDHDLNDNV